LEDFVGLTVKKILPDMKGENMEDTDKSLELPSRANNDKILGLKRGHRFKAHKRNLPENYRELESPLEGSLQRLQEHARKESSILAIVVARCLSRNKVTDLCG
jgi:hypothetical protein